MPHTLWIRIAWLASLGMTASCAASPPPSVAPPRLILPRAATTPCRLDRLPEAPTEADLEAGYAARGARLVECDAARRLAVATLLQERALQDRWRAGRRPGAARWRQLLPGGRQELPGAGQDVPGAERGEQELP